MAMAEMIDIQAKRCIEKHHTAEYIVESNGSE